MNTLRDRRGFTLTELLCAVLIVLLVSALLTVGVRFAGRTYNSSMQLSEAQELCSTLTSVISDKLRFCGTVTPGADGSLDHIFIQDLGSVEGEGAAFQVDADGQLTLVLIEDDGAGLLARVPLDREALCACAGRFERC